MVKSRVVTHFGVPHFYFSFCRFCICAVLCLSLLGFPYIFSGSSPRQFSNIKAKYLNRIHTVQVLDLENGKVEEWKQLNVSFVYKDVNYLGFIHYCTLLGPNESQKDIEKLESRVIKCEGETKSELVLSLEFGDEIDTYHDSDSKIGGDPNDNVLYFKEDISKYYWIEFIFSCVLSFFTLLLSFFCFSCCTCASEVMGCNRYSYLKPKYVPKHKLLDDETVTSPGTTTSTTSEKASQSPLDIRETNSYHCGMIDFRRGYLLTPRLSPDHDEEVTMRMISPTTYQLSNRESFFPFLPKNLILSFWGSLAVTNRSKNEKEEVILNIKLPRRFTVYLKYLICGPLFCGLFHVICFFFTVPVIYLLFDQVLGMYGYICLWFAALIVFSLVDSVVSRGGTGLMKVYANEFLVTDSRIVICEISEKYYNPTAKNIKYLYYDDIESLDLEMEKKRINIKITQKFDKLTKKSNNNNTFKIEQYTKYLETEEELQMLYGQILEAKKFFMDSLSAVVEEEDGNFDGMDQIPGDIEQGIQRLGEQIQVTFGEYDRENNSGDEEEYRYPTERLLQQSDHALELREYEDEEINIEDLQEDSLENVD